MRIAIVSDIHGNLTALEAVVRDLRETAPDLVLHGGDLAFAGARPAEVIDRVRALGWPGVYGNVDELLFRPDSLMESTHGNPLPISLLIGLRDLGEATSAGLGPQRCEWLASLPMVYKTDELSLVHASPGSVWHGPPVDASDAELQSTFGALRSRLVVYGHIHRPYVRELPGLTIANSGSVSQSLDGDPRAAYLLVTDGRPEIRRVEYEMQRELEALKTCALPHADWLMRMLVRGPGEMPSPKLGMPVK